MGWKAELCDCFKAFPACCIACNSVAILQGFTDNALNGGGGCGACCLAYCLGSIGSAINRNSVRTKYDLPGNCFLDCILYGCCLGTCLATQEYREVFKRQNNHD